MVMDCYLLSTIDENDLAWYLCRQNALCKQTLSQQCMLPAGRVISTICMA